MYKMENSCSTFELKHKETESKGIRWLFSFAINKKELPDAGIYMYDRENYAFFKKFYFQNDLGLILSLYLPQWILKTAQ